ncbi:MAG: type I DNA topoisomerase [Candidatus Omnitrophota bacterium]
MNLYINGEKQEINSAATLRELLRRLDVDPETVVVEHNQAVIPREKLEHCPLTEGDRIEIVHFVGGGRPDPEEPPAAEGPSAAEEPPTVEKPPRKKSAGAPKKKSSPKKSKVSGGPANLVIVESPAKAKTINKFLGQDYQVEASMGHVRDLPRSKMGVNIQNNFEPEYIIIRKASKTVKHLKAQAKGKTHIYLAADPDREGEAISWHLAYIFGIENPEAAIQRVVFNEITKEAIQEAFHHPREIAKNLVDAQQARRILDRIVGYELSPLLWRKVGRGLSAGRVQSVALRLIVEREQEIRDFTAVEYWTLEAKVASEKPENEGKIFLTKLDRIGDEKADLKVRDVTEAARQEILSLPFRVERVERKERVRKTQPPFTTSKLQQEAFNRLRFPAAKTMKIAQRLYEGVELREEGSVGLISYMRTDSVHVAVSAQAEAAEFIRAKFGPEYLPEKPPVYKSKKGAQEAHEAVRPTSARRDPESIRYALEEDEYKLYDLIWRKFLGSQMVPAVDEQISVAIAAGDRYHFRSSGRRNLFPGFDILMVPAKEELAAEGPENGKDALKGSEAEEEATPGELPNLSEGEILKLHELMGYQHFTKPPSRYNDASLVKILEERGIGRPSTYAPTIYTLLSRDYVGRKGSALMPTELGEIVAVLLIKHFPRIVDVFFTAEMEEELDKIEDGQVEWTSVLKTFYGPFEADIQAAKNEMQNIRREVTPTDYVCDVCAKPLVMKWGRFGKFMACTGFPDCKFTRSIPTGHFCPEPGCGGELVKRMSKKRRTFYGCSKYPKCTYLVNRLPKTEDELGDDDKISEADRETLGP